MPIGASDIDSMENADFLIIHPFYVSCLLPKYVHPTCPSGQAVQAAPNSYALFIAWNPLDARWG